MNKVKGFKALLIVPSFLLASFHVQGMSVDFDYPDSYSGFDGDPIFEEIGLEWMRWDITNGMSINSALETYGSSGWRLASNLEMSELLNFNGFPDVQGSILSIDNQYVDGGFIPEENVTQFNWDPSASTNPLSDFEDRFGITSHFCPQTGNEVDEVYASRYGCGTYTSALYGDDLDEDGLFNRVSLEYRTFTDPNIGSFSEISNVLSSDVYDLDSAFNTIGWTDYASGVALVRDISVTPVPLPPSLGMFGMALFGLGIWKRKIVLRRKSNDS